MFVVCILCNKWQRFSDPDNLTLLSHGLCGSELRCRLSSPLLRTSPGWTQDFDKGCNLIWRSRFSSAVLSAEVIVLQFCDRLSAIRDSVSPAVLAPYNLAVQESLCYLTSPGLAWSADFPGIISLDYFRAVLEGNNTSANITSLCYLIIGVMSFSQSLPAL